MTFRDLYAGGRVPLSSIDDHVDEWRRDGSGLSLPDYLGLTEGEYALFAENPSRFDLLMRFRYGHFQGA